LGVDASEWTTDARAFKAGSIGLLVVEVPTPCAYCESAPRIDGSALCAEHNPIVTWVRVPEDDRGAWALIVDTHLVGVSDAYAGKGSEGGNMPGTEARMIPGSPSHVRHYGGDGRGTQRSVAAKGAL
jgi:hypothetical protein